MATDCFLPSRLSYNDLFDVCGGGVCGGGDCDGGGGGEGGGNLVFEKGCVSASPSDLSGGPSRVVFAGCLRVARRSCQ